MEKEIINSALKPKDYKSDQEVKWCPGCGDYAILNAVQKAMAELGLKKEEVVFISGIGCSSRFPYYIDTYGFHTIHGRAAAIATGAKIANKNLSVWITTGDGDALAIGGNHFIHVIRRNVNMNMILFNNQIYGLTKGQYSPTSKKNQITKSSPHGTIEKPFNPGQLAMGCHASFYARVPDTDVKLMNSVMIQAEKHQGFSLVEVLQNCVIFNDKAHTQITDKENKEENQLILEHQKPMIFGKNKDKGIILNNLNLEVVEIGKNGVSEKDILVHDAQAQSPVLHQMLIEMKLPDLPVAMGVIRDVGAETYDEELYQQMNNEKEKTKFSSLNDLFLSGNTFS